jgi:membrane protease YdiL (CAAX protease family)
MSQSVGGRRPIWARRSSLLLYFVLAFALSWWVWPLRLLNPTSSPLVPFGPALAAFAVSALVEGRRSVLDLLRRLARWRVHVVWYLVALAGPFALTTLAVALTIAAGAPPPTFAGYLDWPVVLATVAQTAVVVGLFEEPGWRGFALPRMQSSLGAGRAALVLGVIWVLWHLPLLISDRTGQRPWAPFSVWAVAESVILAWLYNGTGGSLPIVILFHSAGNTSVRYVLPEFTAGDYVMSWWILALVNVAAAFALVTYVGPGLSQDRVEKTAEGAFPGEVRSGPRGLRR